MSKVKFLKPVSAVSDGAITSYACGEIVDLDSDVATAYTTAGYCEAYTLLTPTGNKAITANGSDIDVAQYATVSVNVTASTTT